MCVAGFLLCASSIALKTTSERCHDQILRALTFRSKKIYTGILLLWREVPRLEFAYVKKVYLVVWQLWYALAKTLSEHAAWALAMDRKLNMVSINAGLVLGPGVSQQNPLSTMSYLKGTDACDGISIYSLSFDQKWKSWSASQRKILKWSSICFNYKKCNRDSSNVWKWSPRLCRCELPGWCPYSSFPGPLHVRAVFLLQSDCAYWGRSCQTYSKPEPSDIIAAKVRSVIKEMKMLRWRRSFTNLVLSLCTGTNTKEVRYTLRGWGQKSWTSWLRVLPRFVHGTQARSSSGLIYIKRGLFLPALF